MSKLCLCLIDCLILDGFEEISLLNLWIMMANYDDFMHKSDDLAPFSGVEKNLRLSESAIVFVWIQEYTTKHKYNQSRLESLPDRSPLFHFLLALFSDRPQQTTRLMQQITIKNNANINMTEY